MWESAQGAFGLPWTTVRLRKGREGDPPEADSSESFFGCDR